MRSIRILAILVLGALPLEAQRDTSLLTVERIFSREFSGEFSGPTRGLDDSTYTAVESSPSGNQIVRIDAATGRKSVLVSSDLLKPSAGDSSLQVEDYEWSADRQRLLIFTHSERVWRAN